MTPSVNPGQSTGAGRLPGAVIGREWMQGCGRPPKAWEAGLWGLDAGVSAAVHGGWTDEEILCEVRQLMQSYRQPSDDE